MMSAAWLPADIDGSISAALVMRTSQRLLNEASYIEDKLVRLLQSDDVTDAAMRFEWALMQINAD